MNSMLIFFPRYRCAQGWYWYGREWESVCCIDSQNYLFFSEIVLKVGIGMGGRMYVQ